MRNEYVQVSLENHLFFGRIMKEHSLFIRGLLDPSEKDLICKADDFATEYCELIEEAKKKDCQANEANTSRIPFSPTSFIKV